MLLQNKRKLLKWYINSGFGCNLTVFDKEQ